ncbi:UNVERIFIED_CONTAM: hypothetical protein GTU68_032383 [Idotea baltica]|nr:hypothetical protein [Idotea baltica]
MEPYLSIENLSCHYGETLVIDNLSFTLRKGEIGSLLGPSGCGKTSILRAITGFLQPSKGEIRLGDRLLSSPDTIVPPEDRNLGLVYQDFALFPHLNVYQNICFGIYKKPKKAQEIIADGLLKLIQLEGYENRMPSELSGGQQQRVALARSLATNPDILLLDEPFSGLDVELRRELSLSVRDILKERGTTALLVTHDQEEAFAVADQIGVIRKGQLQQWDTAFNLYHRPVNRFTADFVGRGCFLPGTLLEENAVTTELGEIRGEGQGNLQPGSSVDLLLRPDDLVEDTDSQFLARISKKLFIGSSTLYQLTMPSGTLLEATFPSHHDYEIGDELAVSVDAPHLVAFPRS